MSGATVALGPRGRARAAGRDALIAVAALTVVAAALRFSTLGLQSYWYNEAATALLTKLSLGDMLDRIPRMEGNPPLYYVLAWTWVKAFGAGEVGLRSLSALCGTAMVPAAYVVGARLAGARAGVVRDYRIVDRQDRADRRGGGCAHPPGLRSELARDHVDPGRVRHARARAAQTAARGL